MNEVHPLNPKTLEQKSTVPNVVVAVINQLIKKNWNGNCSTIRVNDILAFVGLVTNYPIEVIMGSNWIETAKVLYQGSGYKVAETDKSGDKYLEFKLI
jgi:hypothetical protein